MQNKREQQPIPGRYRNVAPEPRRLPAVVEEQLAVVSDETAGYNPYDNPAPAPSDIEAERALFRRRNHGPG